MTRLDALKIHAFQRAAAQLSIYFTAAVTGLAGAMGILGADLLAVCGAALAFTGILASVATDMNAKRIPNELSGIVLASALLWWAGAVLGSGIAGGSNTAVLLPLADLDWFSSAAPSVIPDFTFGYPTRILVDIIAMVAVFVPLMISFQKGLGFGGGDVKLIAAGSLFMGWPLAFEFLISTFMIGGIFSAVIVAGRSVCRKAVRRGACSSFIRSWSELRDFPYAPAIAVAAILCFAKKLEGMI